MEVLIDFIQNESFQDLRRLSTAISKLREEKLVSRAFLDQNQDDINFFNDFLSGFHKFTFLIQGNPQVGKTTFLNCLLEDDIFINMKENCINILQYDANCQEPELFTAHLQDIFNMNKQVFSMRPEQLTQTGMKGRDQIQSFLEQKSDKETQNEENQNVYIVRYKIKWLEDLINDKKILNRIQFVDYNVSMETDLQYNNIRILQKIETSKYYYGIFVADGQKLFTQNVAQKYNESQSEKALVIINRTDTLGTHAHFRKIEKRLPILSEKFGKDIDEIKEIIEDCEETHQMRNEIFYQSFLEDQNIPLEDNSSAKPLYFISGLSRINKILLENFQQTTDEKTKTLINNLFVKRNQANKAIQAIRRRSEELNILAIQGFLDRKNQAEEYINDNSLAPVQQAIGEIAKTELFDSDRNVFNGIKDQKASLKIVDSYSSNKLSEAEIEELSNLFENQIKGLFSESLQEITKSLSSLLASCVPHLYNFANQVKEINPDYYYVKANHKKQLLEKFEDFKTQWESSTKGFKKNSESQELARENQINQLLLENEQKKHLHLFLKDTIQPVNQQIKEETLQFIQTVLKLADYIEKSLEFFVRDIDGGNFVSKIYQYFAHLFSKNNQIQVFDERVASSIAILGEVVEIMRKGYEKYHLEVRKNLQDNFEDYKNNAPGFSLERTREIIKQTLSN